MFIFLMWILTLYVPDGTTVVLRYNTLLECEETGDKSITPKYLCENEDPE